VCTDALAFYGGYFDVYGMAFSIAGGYTADLWSDGTLGGYQLNDSITIPPLELIALLRPHPADPMQSHEAHTDVGNVRNNHPGLLNSA
jgi:hypothetical protein